MVLRRVWCRFGPSRAPPVKMASRQPRRASRICGDSSFIRAAASSIANGSPSRRTQISATALALVVVNWNSGLTACARWRKSATDGECASAAWSGRCARSGNSSVCSARTCNTSRLVTSTLSCGQDVSRSATCDAAPTTCSKLSSSSSTCCCCNTSAMRAERGCPTSSRMPSAWAMVGMTSKGSLMGASDIKKTPLTNTSRSSEATCRPRRVLPVPPGPVKVTRRTSSRRRSCPMVATSVSRPMSGVGCTGRVSRRRSRVLSGGKSAGRPAITTWERAIGRSTSLRWYSPRSRRLTPAGKSCSTRSRVVRERST